MVLIGLGLVVSEVVTGCAAAAQPRPVIADGCRGRTEIESCSRGEL